MKILYITYDGLLEPLGGSQVVPYLEGLARRGFRLSVMSWEKPEDLRDAGRLRRMRSRLVDAGVEWEWLRYHRRPSVPATAFDMARGVLRALGHDREAGRLLIHARSYVAGAIGLAVKELTRSPLIFDIRGFWVDERIEAGIWPAGSPVVSLARKVEGALFENADAVVTLTRASATSLRELAPRARPPTIRVTTTCVDLDRFRPAEDPSGLREELGIDPEGQVIAYTGSLSTWYLAEETVRIGREFAARGGGTFLLLTRETEHARRIVGDDADRTIVRTVPHEEIHRWLAAADAGLAAYRRGFSRRATAPTKIGEYLACGLAVAATDGVGDLSEQFEGSDAAFTFDSGRSAASVATELLAASRRPGRVDEARRLAERHYALADGVATYGDLYRNLGIRPGSAR